MYVVQCRLWYVNGAEPWVTHGEYRTLAGARDAAERLSNYHAKLDIRILLVLTDGLDGGVPCSENC